MVGADSIENAKGRDLDPNLGDCLSYDLISWGLFGALLLLFNGGYTDGAGYLGGVPHSPLLFS